MLHALVLLVLFLYGAASIGFLLDVWRGNNKFSLVARRMLGLGFVLHTALNILLALQVEGDVLPESRGDYYLWISWGVPLMYLLLRKRADFAIVGAFVAPLALLFLVSSSYLVHRDAGSAAATGPWFRALHLLPALLAELSLIFAFVSSCVYLIQDRRLRVKSSSGGLFRGPNLDLLDNLNRRFVLVGFGAMTLAIVSGSAWAVVHGIGLLRNDIYQWSAVIVWLLSALICHSRMNSARSPRELSRLTAIAGGFLIIALLLFVFLGGSVEHGGTTA